MTSEKLRPFQQAAVEHVMKHAKRSIIVQAPVASGKTRIFAEVARRFVAKGKRVLVLAHRGEHLDQAAKELNSLGLAVGSIRAGKKHLEDAAAHVQLASVQTLVRRTNRPEADIVIIDEAHHTPAKSYRRILENYPNAQLIGFTATPIRMGGKKSVAELADLFEEIYVTIQPEEAVTKGYLAPLTGSRVFMPPNLADVARKHGDFAANSLGAKMSKKHIVGEIIKRWKERVGPEVSTMLFAATIAQSEVMVRAFRRAGVRAESLSGESRLEVRESTLARFKAGEFPVLCNVSLFTEGTNIERVKCVILARPTYSLVLYLQMIGRGRRPWNNQPCIIHDHGRLVGHHLHPDLARDWKLGGKGDPTATITCPTCGTARKADKLLCPNGCKQEGFEVEDPAWVRGGYEVDLSEFATRRDALIEKARALFIAGKTLREIESLIDIPWGTVGMWSTRDHWMQLRVVTPHPKHEQARKLYVEKIMTLMAVSTALGVSSETIRKWGQAGGWLRTRSETERMRNAPLRARAYMYYVNEGKSAVQVSKLLGLSSSVIDAWAHEEGWARPSKHTFFKSPAGRALVERARRLYVEQGLSTSAVAKLIGRDFSTVAMWGKNGGWIRTYSESAKIAHAKKSSDTTKKP